VALSGAIFHQYHITGAEGAFFSIARAYFKMSLQAKEELMLRWTNILADPASRRPHELQRSGLKSMGNMERRRWGSIVSLIELFRDLLEMSLALAIGVQPDVSHFAFSSRQAEVAQRCIILPGAQLT
jgi:hypothetical protein